MSSQSPHSQAYPMEGEILASKYRVDKVLGVGGMGMVVAAHHLQLDERVALKFLLPEALSNPEAVARFNREARAAVKIKSEHVARVIDVGKLDNGAPYMVMEYLEGGDLDAWIREKGPLKVEQAVEFVLQTCEAIAEAHGLGIVHRDLKPANLFCIHLPDGMLSIKVIDFGISKVTGVGAGPDFGMTKTQTMMGSPLYMSPEQMKSSRGVDARSDIWAIGVILYELLAGCPPFQAEGIPALVLKVVTEPPPSLRAYRPDLPDGLDSVILRCLEKDRDSRFQNVGELAVALRDFGPKRSRASVERVSRLILTSGLLGTALPPTSEQKQALGIPGTMVSFGGTGATISGIGSAKKKMVLGGMGALAIWAGIIGIVVAVRSSGVASEASSSRPLVQSASASVDAATPSIVPDSLPIAGKKSTSAAAKKPPRASPDPAPATPAKPDTPSSTGYNPFDHL